jgi:hypothetical protein
MRPRFLSSLSALASTVTALSIFVLAFLPSYSSTSGISVHCFRRSPLLNNDLEVVPNATARAIVSPSSKSSSYAQPASYKRSLALRRYVHALNCSKAEPPTSKLSGRFHAPQYWPRCRCSHGSYFLNINKVSLLTNEPRPRV